MSGLVMEKMKGNINGTSSETEHIKRKRLKDKMCVLTTDMDIIARKVGAFYDRGTGKYIADSPLMRDKYVKRPKNLVLPLNVAFNAGEFAFTTARAKYTIKFTRVKKNRDYIIEQHISRKSITFSYGSEDELRDKIMDKLNQLNENYDADLQYNAPDDASSEWWVDSALENAINYAGGRGFSSGIDPFGGDWLEDSDEEEDAIFEPPTTLLSVFNVKGLRYNGLHIYNNSYNVSDNKCGWDYLSKFMGFPYKTLGEIKGNYEDAWSCEELIEVAKHYNRYFCIYDLQGEKLRDYKSKDAFSDRTFEFKPENPTHRKAMVFVRANGHIHPYTSKFQSSLLKGVNGSAFVKTDDFNNSCKVLEKKRYTTIWDLKKLPSNTRKDIKAKAEDELISYLADHKDTKYYKEGEFTWKDIGLNKYAYVEDDDLSAVLLGMVENGKPVPLIQSKNGCITELKVIKRNEETDKYDLLWEVKSCPNIGIVKPILDKLDITYIGQDITAVGRLIYHKVLGNNWNDLLSNTLGTIFTPESPFNHSTDISCDEEESAGYGSTYNNGKILERLDITIKEIYASSPRVQADKVAEMKAYNKKVRALINNNVKTSLTEVEEEENKEVKPIIPLHMNQMDFLNLTTCLPLSSRKELTDEDYDNYLKTNTIPELHNEEWLDKLDEECRETLLEEHNDRVEEYRLSLEEQEEKKKSVNLDKLGEWVALDIVKCYTSCLENPYHPFMTFEVFDNAVECDKKSFKNVNGWYYVSHIDEDTTFFPFIGYRNGWFCLKVIQEAIGRKEVFTINRLLKPHAKNILIEDDKRTKEGVLVSKGCKLKAFVEWIYTNLADAFNGTEWEGKSAPKFIINSFIGQLGRYYRESTYSKSYLVNSVSDERYYKLKGLDTYIIRGGESPLYLMVEKKDTEYHRDGLSIHSQILQEAKVKLMELYDLIKWSETRETRVACSGMLSYISWKFSYGKKCLFQDTDSLKKAYASYVASNTKVDIEEVELAVPLMFKTDCILLADYGSGRLMEAISKVPLSSERGGIRIEKQGNGKVVCDTLHDMLVRRFSVNMKDKVLTDSQTKKLVEHKPEDYKMLIDRGEGFRLDGMAGTGKSSLTCGGHGNEGIIPYLTKLGKKYALTATTNKARANALFIENDLEATTIHSFLGIGMGLTKPQDGKKFFKCEGLDYLIIDECSMINKNIMLCLRNIKILYPNLSLILIGDYQQLPAVEKHSREFTDYVMEDTNLLKWLVDFNSIKLTINRRSSEEGVKMFSLFNCLISGKMTKSLMPFFSKMKSKDKKWQPRDIRPINLCWKRTTRDFLNCVIVNKVMNGGFGKSKGTDIDLCEPYINAENKVCKTYKLYDIWSWDGTDKVVKCLLTADANVSDFYYNNQDFYVSKIDGNIIELTDTITDIPVSIDRDQLYKHFDYSYAITIHRSQGSTISQPYSINDWDDMYGKESKALKYVGISRTDDSKNVAISSSISSRISTKLVNGKVVFDRELHLKAIAEGKWFPKQK